MSTRSCIARPLGPGKWAGVYHHSDGYPEGLGRILWNMMHRRYDLYVGKLYKELIDDNLEGWSALHCFHPEWGTLDPKDWDGVLKRGVDDRENRDVAGKVVAPISYQHDSNLSTGVTSPPITYKDPDPLFVEWVYIVGRDDMRVLCSVPCHPWDPGAVKYDSTPEFYYRHVEIGGYPWGAQEPDWHNMDEQRSALREEAPHREVL